MVGGVGKGAFKETFHVKADGVSEALKIYRPGFSAERTKRETEAMKRCAHPNIARLISIEPFKWKGTTYLIAQEEFLAGGTLTTRLEKSGHLNASQILDLGEALIDAVAHIASHDLVHRDLKPDNVLFREDGDTPVIVDFGLVRDLTQNSLTQTWALQGPGTPFFAPPEQLLNE